MAAVLGIQVAVAAQVGLEQERVLLLHLVRPTPLLLEVVELAVQVLP